MIVENVIQIKSEITKMKKTSPEIIKVTKIVPIKIAPTKSASTNFYILLTLLLTTKKVLITVSLHCYLIKCWSKQKRLLPYYNTSGKLRAIDINNTI